MWFVKQGKTCPPPPYQWPQPTSPGAATVTRCNVINVGSRFVR